MSGSRPGPGIAPIIPRAASPTIALNSHYWPASSAWRSVSCPSAPRQSFGAFVAVPQSARNWLGDTGESDPQHWIVGFGGRWTIRVLSPYTPHSRSHGCLQRPTERAFIEGALSGIWRADGMALMGPGRGVGSHLQVFPLLRLHRRH